MKALLLTALIAAVNAGPAEGPKAQLLQAVQASLPIDLVPTEIDIIGRKDWSEQAELVVTWERTVRAGRCMARVQVSDGDEQYRAWASVRLESLRQVLVVKRDVVRGETIAWGDLAKELRPVPESRVVDLSVEALVGQAVLRDLEAGQVLGRKDVALPAPLPRGTPVTVVSTVGGARIQVPGRLVTSVRLGGRGKARIEASRRALRGRLVAPDRFVLEVVR